MACRRRDADDPDDRGYGEIRKHPLPNHYTTSTDFDFVPVRRLFSEFGRAGERQKDVHPVASD